MCSGKFLERFPEVTNPLSIFDNGVYFFGLDINTDGGKYPAPSKQCCNSLYTLCILTTY